MIHVLYDKATPEQLAEMREEWDITVKVAVDIRRGILAGGGELHSDCETVLWDAGSQQEDIWGANWLPELQTIQFNSLINYRPRQKIYSNEIADPLVREQVAAIIQHLLGGI